MEMSYQYSDIGRLQFQISSANQITAYHSFKGINLNLKTQKII